MPIDQKYISAIKDGNVVAFPTETVYGLGADAWDTDAIHKVFTLKGRPSDNPLIVHISEKDQVYDFANSIPNEAIKLMDALAGPLTIVFKKKPEVLDIVTAGLETVAIRMPSHSLALELISKTGPLVAPSANKSGKPSPTKAEHVLEDLGDSVLVLDGNATDIGLESTVLDLTDLEPTILRPGSISRKQIEQILKKEIGESFFHHLKAPRSPGQKYSHYKPIAYVKWLTDEDNLEDTSTLFLLINGGSKAEHIISYSKDFGLLAKELYDRFRQADICGYKKVIIEPFDERYDHPVISALLNRIEKALD